LRDAPVLGIVPGQFENCVRAVGCNNPTIPPGDSDELARLAASARRPPASLSAFGRLAPAQVDLLCDAIEATVARRQTQIDSELARALPELPRPTLVRLLRGPGLRRVRRLVIGRRGGDPAP
jgi:hypothetical protein